MNPFDNKRLRSFLHDNAAGGVIALTAYSVQSTLDTRQGASVEDMIDALRIGHLGQDSGVPGAVQLIDAWYNTTGATLRLGMSTSQGRIPGLRIRQLNGPDAATQTFNLKWYPSISASTFFYTETVTVRPCEGPVGVDLILFAPRLLQPFLIGGVAAIDCACPSNGGASFSVESVDLKMIVDIMSNPLHA